MRVSGQSKQIKSPWNQKHHHFNEKIKQNSKVCESVPLRETSHTQTSGNGSQLKEIHHLHDESRLNASSSLSFRHLDLAH